MCLVLTQVQDHLDSEWRSGGAPDDRQVLALKRAREAIGEAQDALGQATISDPLADRLADSDPATDQEAAPDDPETASD